ncbi:MAG: outer membrane beta-barrel protein [Pseudomonadota bacterium]
MRVSAINPLLGLFVWFSFTEGALAQDGFYLKAGAGVQFTSDLDNEFSRDLGFDFLTCQAIGCNPDRSVSDPDVGVGAAFAIGNRWLGNFRSEIEYRFIRNVVDFQVFEGDFFVSRVDAPLKSNSLSALAFYDFVNSSLFTPFVGGGIGVAFVNQTFGDGTTYSDTEFAIQLRGGVSAKVSDVWSVDLEYIYFDTNDLNFETSSFSDFSSLNVLSFGGDDFRSSSAFISIRRSF